VSQDKKQRAGPEGGRALAAAAGAAVLLSLFLCLQAGPGSLESWGAALNLGSGLEITRGPYLQYPIDGADAMGVLWETNFPSHGSILFGEKGGKLKKMNTAQSSRFHRVILKDLDPAKEYRYRVQAGGRFSRTYEFRPFPHWKKSFTFIAYGDSRSNHKAHQAVMDEMRKKPADFVLHTGDMVDYGNSMDQWDVFFFVARPLAARIPFFPVIGNHEYFKGGKDFYKAAFFLPENSPNGELDYFFDTASARFVILDNRNIGKKGGEQKDWLEGVLKEARDDRKLPHIFVSLHQGIESSGPHGPDKRLEKQGYLDLLKSYGVSLVIGGHDHIYERGVRDGLRYMVSGGGGAPVYSKEKKNKNVQLRASERHFVLFQVDEETVSFEVFRSDGSLIEACTLVKKGYKCGKP